MLIQWRRLDVALRYIVALLAVTGLVLVVEYRWYVAPEGPLPDGPYPYPVVPRLLYPKAKLSRSFCTSQGCNVAIREEVTNTSHFLYQVTRKATQEPARKDMPRVTIYIPYTPGYIPPKALLEPGSGCKGYGKNADCFMECPVECRVTTQKRLKAEADAVMQILDIPISKANEDQYKILWYSEPELPILADPAFMRDVDLVMHWHRSAHVKLMAHDNKYFNADELQYEDGLFPFQSMDRICCSPSEEKVESSIISWAQGNCQGKRAEFAKELSRYVHLTSYGSCMNNSPQPKGLSRYETKLNVMSQHKFCLAMENVLDLEDWVTEKVYHGLIAGCVPVYWGAPNIEEYLPCRNCVIHVKRFGSVRELADYLIFLDKNEEEYGKYLEYKREVVELKPMLQASKRFSFCAACKMLSEAKKSGKKPTKLIYSLTQNQFVPFDENT